MSIDILVTLLLTGACGFLGWLFGREERRRKEYLAKLNALCEKEKALLEDQKKHDREMFEAWKKEKDLTFASLYGSKHLPTKGDA